MLTHYILTHFFVNLYSIFRKKEKFMKYSYRTKGVCAQAINFEIEDGKIYNVSFLGGCNGNLKAISKLIEGMECEKVISLLRGNDCRGRGTSCADQLTIAIENAMGEINK